MYKFFRLLWFCFPILLYAHEYQEIPADYILSLYQLIKDVTEILEKHNIVYWVHAGSLLGAVRHEGIILWDDDADIAISVDDEQRVEALRPEFEKLDYRFSLAALGYQVGPSGNSQPCMDIMFYKKDHNGDYMMRWREKSKKPWHQFIFRKSELFPLKRYKFGSITVLGPANPKPYLDDVYPEWDKFAIIYNHNFQSGVITIPLTPDLCKCAEPCGPLRDRVFV